MKTLKNIMLSIIVLVLMVFASPSQILAAISTEVDNPEELYGLAFQNYTVDNYLYTQECLSKTEDIILSSYNLIIENNAESEWIDVIAKLNNGKFINITNEVEWDSEDYDIAYIFNGRVFAESPGETNITVKYGVLKKNIHVTVLHYLDIAEEIEKLDCLVELDYEDKEAIEDGPELFLSASDRNEIIDRAKAMTDVTWVPNKDLNGWTRKGHFKAGKKYKGIPYSQTYYQKDDKEFITAMQNKDFYDEFKIGKILMPKYGSDCSGFVSFAWGLKRNTTYDFVTGINNGTYSKVGSYDPTNLSKKELEKAYKKLKKGDAVVFRRMNKQTNQVEGHTFIIAKNDIKNSKVYAYEQTPYKATYTSHSYSSMAGMFYMPFSKK